MEAQEIGKQVLAQRRNLQLRQGELADLSGVSERFIRELEKGKSTVQLDKVIAVLKALGLEMYLRDHNPLRLDKQ